MALRSMTRTCVSRPCSWAFRAGTNLAVWTPRPGSRARPEGKGGQMSVTAEAGTPAHPSSASSKALSEYPSWFYIPAAVVYGVLFLFPTIASLFFSLTRWTLFDAQFIGLANFVQFFREPFLVKGLVNTLVYG